MSQYPTNPKVIAALIDHRTRHGLTNGALGKLFDVSPTFISKYINDNLDRDPLDFTERVFDVLHSIAARLDLSSTIFENALTAEFAGRVNLARRTQDVVFIFGSAGTGKTCSALHYLGANPSTLYHKVTGRSCSAADLEAGIFAAMRHKEGYKANQRRWPFMVTSMKGDGGAIIIDNAHRLDRSGRDWGFDFNEETGKAIIFVGNPEMQAKVNENDQQQSRSGVKWECTWVVNKEKKIYHKQLPEMARRVASQFSDDDFAEQISDLVAFVATMEGRLRSVRKATILARELSVAKKITPREAFREAHRNGMRSYLLPAD